MSDEFDTLNKLIYTVVIVSTVSVQYNILITSIYYNTILTLEM